LASCGIREKAALWTWQQIAPLLEAAMDSLGERDRNAVVLRYLEGKSLGDPFVVMKECTVLH
jgi:DNA-directed RNA polymerase specialized sigma24 family protein